MQIAHICITHKLGYVEVKSELSPSPVLCGTYIIIQSVQYKYFDILVSGVGIHTTFTRCDPTRTCSFLHHSMIIRYNTVILLFVVQFFTSLPERVRLRVKNTQYYHTNVVPMG